MIFNTMTATSYQLPAVSLCHDRCKFLEEAMHSLMLMLLLCIPSSPDNCPSSSTNSETSHIDFRSNSEDEEFRYNKDFDSLHTIHQNQFNSYFYDHQVHC